MAILIAAIWGFNFVAIKAGVAGIPPLMLAALRFTFCVIPAIFFVKRPDAPLKGLAAYGLLLGVGEFGFLFTAMKLGAPAGISSIILQSQAFFTAIFGAVFLKERIRPASILAMLVAASGLAIFGLQSLGPVAGATGSAPIPFYLILMLIAGAAMWALANVVARTMPKAGGLGLVVWSSLFSPLPLAALSFVIEGPTAMVQALQSLSWATVASLAYLVILSTLVGYGLWNKLIMDHGAGKIAPFSLMVPVFALLASVTVLGESLEAGDAIGAALILAGLVIHVLGSRPKKQGPQSS
jgi:O-acetylserine/cysteine efflux transporter